VIKQGGGLLTSPLEDEITRIREMLSVSRAHFSTGQGAESNVVENIIRPILRSIGWTEEGNRILNEFEVRLKRKKGRADLVLSKGHDKYILAIEAKKLGDSVDGHTRASEDNIEQLIEYLVSLDREFGVLTDGERWHLIRRTGYYWETIWIKNILNEELSELTRAFDYISPNNSEALSDIIELEKRKEEVLNKEWQKMKEDRDLQVKILADVLLKQVKSKYEDVSLEPQEVSKFLGEKYGGLPPADIVQKEDYDEVDDSDIISGDEKKFTRPPKGSKIRIDGITSSWVDIESSYREIIT
jgi:predicted type IV restriction endonuclease